MTNFPEVPLDVWRPTKNTVHLYLQIVCKIRLALHPRVNHWWHVPLYVSPRGLTTQTIPHNYGSFEIEFDFHDHELKIRTKTLDSSSSIFSNPPIRPVQNEPAGTPIRSATPPS